MKKTLCLLMATIFLTGCIESMAMVGAGSSNGQILRSSLNSEASMAVKHQTGKTPIQHFVGYVEKNNPKQEKKKCVNFLESTSSEVCAIAKDRVAKLKQKIKEKYKVKNLLSPN